MSVAIGLLSQAALFGLTPKNQVPPVAQSVGGCAAPNGGLCLSDEFP